MKYYLRTISIVLTLERAVIEGQAVDVGARPLERAVNEGQAVGVGQRVRWREQLMKDRLWTSDSASVGESS